jgi:LDH2 family malate/lactate/ureidoglycolate dehydrogenase
MKVAIDEMRNLCKHLVLSHGLAEKEAMIIANDYLDAEMRGKPFHGLKAFSPHHSLAWTKRGLTPEWIPLLII